MSAVVKVLLLIPSKRNIIYITSTEIYHVTEIDMRYTILVLTCGIRMVLEQSPFQQVFSPRSKLFMTYAPKTNL